MVCGLRAGHEGEGLSLPVRFRASIGERKPVFGVLLAMTTKLDKTIRREIEIDGEPFTVAISPDGIRLTKKRFRSGRALSWRALWRGELGPAIDNGIGNQNGGPTE